MLVLLLVLVGCNTPSVTRVVIRSSEGGNDEAGNVDQLEIVCQAEACSTQGQPIPMQRVTAFLNAVAAPAISQPQLANLGITQEWLNQTAATGLRAEGGCEFSYRQKALVLPKLTNLEEVQRLLPTVLKPLILDAYRDVSVDILKNDRTIWHLYSSSESEFFMLPWEVTTPKLSFANYNADISRALAELLPEQFVNRESITGEHISRELAMAVAHNVLDSCEALVCTPCHQLVLRLRRK